MSNDQSLQEFGKAGGDSGGQAAAISPRSEPGKVATVKSYDTRIGDMKNMMFPILLCKSWCSSGYHTTCVWER